jgi:hypothetical protein
MTVTSDASTLSADDRLAEKLRGLGPAGIPATVSMMTCSISIDRRIAGARLVPGPAVLMIARHALEAAR